MHRILARKKQSVRYTPWVIIALTITGLAAISARLMLSNQFMVSGGDTLWTIDIEASIPSASVNDRILLSPPWDTKLISIVAQKLHHVGIGFMRARADEEQKREIDLKVETEGNVRLSAEFTAHVSSTSLLRIRPPAPPLSLEQRGEYLGSYEYVDEESPTITITLNIIGANTRDKTWLSDEIFEYVNTRIIRDTTVADNSPDQVLKSGHASTLGRARTMIALCRAAGIPARIVTGFILEETIDAEPYYWVELFLDEGWVSYDPEKGYKNTLPDNYLPFNRGGEAIVSAEKPLSVTYDIEQHFDLEVIHPPGKKSFQDIFNLERFPPGIRSTLAVILLLPFGALITTLIRTFIGVRCYGTFTPTLAALAAVYADWVVVAVLLAIVVALGMTGRTIVPGKLLRVPRLSMVFTIVAMSMAMGVSLMDYFNYPQGAHVVLLPIVILTTLIDRFYSTIDEDGIKLAMRRLIWTTIIAVACYAVLRIDELGHLLLAYPEIHFFTMAMVLLTSSYKGKKVSNIPYFNWLAEPKKKKVKEPVDNPDTGL